MPKPGSAASFRTTQARASTGSWRALTLTTPVRPRLGESLCAQAAATLRSRKSHRPASSGTTEEAAQAVGPVEGRPQTAVGTCANLSPHVTAEVRFNSGSYGRSTTGAEISHL